jgi:polyhydroxyalkanoate synthesis regulator phasin
MAAPADDERRGARGLAEDLLLAGVGAISLTKERTDELVEELAGKGRMSGEEARRFVDDMTGRWRGEALRVGERASFGVSGVLRELGLVTRREWEELELRLAQVEHRLRLVEGSPQRPTTPGP